MNILNLQKELEIDDIKSIKNQIDVKQKVDYESLHGYNIKIGRGGIREIEFPLV